MFRLQLTGTQKNLQTFRKNRPTGDKYILHIHLPPLHHSISHKSDQRGSKIEKEIYGHVWEKEGNCYKASFHAFRVPSGRSKLNKWFFSSINVLACSSISTVTIATKTSGPQRAACMSTGPCKQQDVMQLRLRFRIDGENPYIQDYSLGLSKR